MAVTGENTRQSVFNELDEFGLLLGQSRLIGERNALYKQRLARVFSERASSTYRGLINSITRGLGLELFDALTIEALESAGTFLATNPAIVFSESFVYLYEDFENLILDRTLDRFDSRGDSFFLTDLVDKINESSLFLATLGDGVNGYTPAMTVLNQKSHIFVTSEIVPIATRFELENNNIVAGTIFFSDRIVFRTQVSSEAAADATGKFFVDHKTGYVVSFTAPNSSTEVRYEYLKNPLVAKASPVIIHNMQSLDFKVKLFEQVLTDDGTFTNGLPTSLGADLINELLSVHPIYWGE